MFGKNSDIGFDLSFVCDPKDDTLTTVHVDGVPYKIVRSIYALESLLGHGTKVWDVERGSVEYVLKDSWIQADRVESKTNHLRLMLGYDMIKLKVPTFIGGVLQFSLLHASHCKCHPRILLMFSSHFLYLCFTHLHAYSMPFSCFYLKLMFTYPLPHAL